MRLQDKVVLITGSSRGLGLALARACAREGASLVLNGRDGSALAAAVAAVRTETPDVELIAVEADATHEQQVERLVSAALARFGRVDVLINNAGTLGPAPLPPLLETSQQALLEVLRVNAAGPFLVSRAVLPGMLERRSGSIVNVISEAGLVGYPGWGPYGMSKAALELMTQVWAVELEGSGVRVNSVNPGEMDTAMHALAFPDEDPAQYVSPELVVEPFLHLASDASAEISGQRFHAQPE